MTFKPVKLVNSDGTERTAQTAAEEAKLRHDGWRTTPLKKTSSAKAAGDSKAAPKPGPKN